MNLKNVTSISIYHKSGLEDDHPWIEMSLAEYGVDKLEKRLAHNIYVILKVDNILDEGPGSDSEWLFLARPHDVVAAVDELRGLQKRYEGEPYRSTKRLITMLECCRFDERPMNLTAEADLLNAIAGLKNILKYM